MAIKRLWECSNPECKRTAEAGLNATAGIVVMKCEKCRSVMFAMKDFYYCDNCDLKEENMPTAGWLRFSYGAMCWLDGNWTSGQSKTIEFCGEKCFTEFMEKELKYIPGLSKKSYPNNAINSLL